MINRFQHLDGALEYFYNSTHWTRKYEVEKHLETKFPKDAKEIDIDAIIEKLVRDYSVIEEYPSGPLARQMGATESPVYAISFDGILLAESGGYNAKAIKDRADRTFQENKMRLEIKNINSGIRTNRSVRNTNNIQKWLIGLATLLSAGSFIISILNYRKETVINVPAPTVILQSPPVRSAPDTSFQNTLQNQPAYQKKKSF